MTSRIQLTSTVYIEKRSLFSFELISALPLEVEKDSKGDIVKVFIKKDTRSIPLEIFKEVEFSDILTIIPRYIQQDDKEGTEFTFYQDLPTITTLFIIPLVLPYFYIKNVYNNILNAYSFLELPIGPVNKCHIVFRMSPSSHFISFLADVSDFPNFSEYDDLDAQLICTSFNIPEQFKKDVELISLGKYSQISEEAKASILAYILSIAAPKPKPIEDYLLYNVLYKTDKRREELSKKLGLKNLIPEDVDLYEGFDPIRETFITSKMTKKSHVEKIANKEI